MEAKIKSVDALIKEIDNDLEYKARFNSLVKLLNEAKQRQDIAEYKRLYIELLGKEVEIYTVPASRDRLIPWDRDPNKDTEFWFDFQG